MDPTLAYLDAGTGSIILQAVLGGTAAVLVAMKLWWRSALRFLHIRRDDEHGDTGSSA